MPWVRVDDQRWLNPKVLMLSMEADCLDVRGMQWSSAQRRDGLVVRNALPLLCGGMPAGRTPHDIAQELVDAGRWLPHPEGWLIHDFLEYQPSWADAEAQAQKRSDAARKAAEARWAKNDAESVPPACDEQCDSHAERIADGVPGHEGIASARNAPGPTRPGPARPDPFFFGRRGERRASCGGRQARGAEAARRSRDDNPRHPPPAVHALTGDDRLG